MVDMVVVGGGPAGCAAALTLRSEGASTTLITSHRLREKPTETAVSRLRQLLQSLGAGEALAACEPCYGVESSWGAARPVLRPGILEPSGHPWFIHRTRFDALLLGLADATGAVRLEAEAIGARFVDDKVIVNTTAGSVEARNLVIATGSPGWAARVTGEKSVTMDSLVCYWARLSVPIESRLLHVESTESGWWYLCPGEDTTTIACFLTDAKGSRELVPSTAASWNSLFQNTWLCRRHAIDAPAEQIYRLPVSVTALARRCGPRWAAAGDAAIKLDPVGSSGSATALESGMLAARAVLAGQAAADTYDRWGNRFLTHFLQRRTALYATEVEKYPAGFWARRPRSLN